MRCVGQKHKSGAVGHHQWGKYGVINESECVSCSGDCVKLVLTGGGMRCSLYNKEQEFRAWLVEERKINPETITKDQTKKEFARFAEDYNTGEAFVDSRSVGFVPCSRDVEVLAGPKS